MKMRPPLALLLGGLLSASSVGCAAVDAIVSSPASRPTNRKSSAERMVSIGRVFENQGQYDQAEAMYQKAQRLNPGNAEIRSQLTQLAERRSEMQFGPGGTIAGTTQAIAAADSVSRGNQLNNRRNGSGSARVPDGALASQTAGVPSKVTERPDGAAASRTPLTASSERISAPALPPSAPVAADTEATIRLTASQYTASSASGQISNAADSGFAKWDNAEQLPDMESVTGGAAEKHSVPTPDVKWPEVLETVQPNRGNSLVSSDNSGVPASAGSLTGPAVTLQSAAGSPVIVTDAAIPDAAVTDATSSATAVASDAAANTAVDVFASEMETVGRVVMTDNLPVAMVQPEVPQQFNGRPITSDISFSEVPAAAEPAEADVQENADQPAVIRMSVPMTVRGTQLPSAVSAVPAPKFDEVIAAAGDPDANVSLLLRALRAGETPDVRCAAATLLGECDSGNLAVTQILAATLYTEKDEGLLLAIADSQFQRQEATRQTAYCMAKMASNDQSIYQIQAITSMMHFAGTESHDACVETLMELLMSSRATVRAAAAVTLGDFAQLSNRALAALTEIAAEDGDASVREAARSAIARRRPSSDEQAVPVIIQGMR